MLLSKYGSNMIKAFGFIAIELSYNRSFRSHSSDEYDYAGVRKIGAGGTTKAILLIDNSNARILLTRKSAEVSWLQVQKQCI